MDRLIPRLLGHNWQQKLAALCAAITVWILVNHSITATRLVPNVPVRIVGLPSNKTVRDLLPSGLLTRRINLTLVGTKDVIENLETSDLEVHIDAKGKGDEWIAEIGRKNLVSINPDINISRSVKHVSATEFIMKLSRLVTEEVPIRILPPRGEPPAGYQFLDIWPQRMMHTISGAEEKILELQERGLEVTFDLGDISQRDLDVLQSEDDNFHDDEVSFFVPSAWKRVSIPFLGEVQQPINDLRAKDLHIDFLRTDFLPLDRPIPIRVFYPEKNSRTINPDTYSLSLTDLVVKQNGLTLLKMPLFVKDVSRLFLDVVRDHVEITMHAVPKSERERLVWSVQFINPSQLENAYVERLLKSTKSRGADSQEETSPAQMVQDMHAGGWGPILRENYLRQRFRDYMQRFQLFKSETVSLELEMRLQGGAIEVTDVSGKGGDL